MKGKYTADNNLLLLLHYLPLRALGLRLPLGLSSCRQPDKRRHITISYTINYSSNTPTEMYLQLLEEGRGHGLCGCPNMNYVERCGLTDAPPPIAAPQLHTAVGQIGWILQAAVERSPRPP